MLESKVQNQASLLKYFAKYRKKVAPDLSIQLYNAAERIREIGRSITSLDPSNAAVRTMAMGLEGHAASIYWGSLKKMLPINLQFSGRITRSAKDKINQALNYAYGILYGEVWRAVVKAGLDPYFGLIHGAKKDQGSLVFDLIEEFRAPFADRVVIGMVGRGFSPNINKDGYLKTKTKKQIAISFSKKWFKTNVFRSQTLPAARILENQAISLVKVYMNNEKYFPYKMRW